MSDNKCVGCADLKNELKKLTESMSLIRLENEEDLKTSNIYLIRRIQDLEESVQSNKATISDLKKAVEDYDFLAKEGQVKLETHEKQE